MNWSNLNKGICINECNEPLESKNAMIFCKYCNFKIRKNKYLDLIKGKESSAYQKTVKRFQKLKDYKEKMKQSINQNVEERNSNLRRMFAKGKITEAEYNIKINK